jgi:hypothetical protein
LVAIVHFPSSPHRSSASVETVRNRGGEQHSGETDHALVLQIRCCGADERHVVEAATLIAWTVVPEQVFRPALDGGDISKCNPNGYSAVPCERSPEERARRTSGFDRRILVAAAGDAAAQSHQEEGVQSRSASRAARTCSTGDVELGVADDPALTSPQNGPLGALRIGGFRTRCSGSRLEGVGIPRRIARTA